MDVTCGLISNFVKSKSVERVLAPIASQVSLLIILNEGVSSGRDHVQGQTTLSQISTCAAGVSQAVERLVSVAKKQVESTSQDDFKQAMCSACETLELASSGFYVAAQKYQANPNTRQVRGTLVQGAKDVLQGILKVLLVSDDSEVKRTVNVVEETKVKVTAVGMVTNMKDLVSAFKTLTNRVMMLVSMVTRRIKDLINPSHKEQLITSVTVLKKSLSTLNMAVQTYLKYHHNPQAKAGKLSVIEQIHSTLDDIRTVLESKHTKETTLGVEEPGYFVSRINFLLDALTEGEVHKLHQDVETWTAGVVRHGMAVAHLCTDEHRDQIITHCQQVLQLKGELVTLTGALKHSPAGSHDRSDILHVRESLCEALCGVEEHVNMALLHLMVDVFKENTEPLERLLKGALAPKQTSASENVHFLVSEFSEHADMVYQVASLAAASSTDSKRVRVIRAAVYHLEKLDPDIVPSIQTVAKHPDNVAALRHLKLLVKDWKAELSALVEVLDEMVDPKLFIKVSESKLEEDISAVRGSLLQRDQTGANEAISCVFCRTRRVGLIARAVVDHSTDAVFRNGLLVFVKKLQQAESITKEALKFLHKDFHNPGLQETCLKHLNLLKGFVNQVREGLSPANHPDILSPERMMVYHTKRPRILSGSRLLRKQKKSSTDTRHKHSSGDAKKQDTHREFNRYIKPDDTVQQCSAPSPVLRVASVQSGQLNQPPSLSAGESSTDDGPVAVNLGVKMSDIRLLARQFVTAAVAGDKQRVNILTSDLLGWTNHIVDAALSLTKHCKAMDKAQEVESLCREADQLAPETISKGKYVAAGDIGEVAALQHTADTWANKLDKARVRVDVQVDVWKDVADGVLSAIQKGNLDNLKSQVIILESHKDALCNLLTKVKSISPDACEKAQVTLTFLNEQQDDLENITVTIKTTADLTLQTANATDISLYRGQLGQLCREWAVLVTCLFGALNQLHSLVLEEAKVKVKGLGEATLNCNASLKKETDKMKEMVKAISTGLLQARSGERREGLSSSQRNTELETRSSSLCESLDSCTDELANPSLHEYSSVQDPSVYIAQHSHLQQVLWLSQMVEGRRLVEDGTREVSQCLSTLHSHSLHLHRLALTDPSVHPQHKSDYLIEVSKMAANFSMLQQKVLNAIQLSPDLARRSDVRHCLDTITVLSPKLLDRLKSFVEDSLLDRDEGEWEELHTEWSVEMRRLLLLLQDMPDVRPSLCSEVMKLITVEEKKKFSPKKSPKTPKSRPPVRCEQVSTPARPTHPVTPHTPLSALRSKGGNSAVGTPTNKPFRSIMISVGYLEDVSRQWENSDNPVIHTAMAIVNNTQGIAEYCRGIGDIEDVSGLISAAEGIVENAKKMQMYLRTLAESCVEESQTRDIEMCVDRMSSFSTQLTIISNVLLNSPSNHEGEKIVLRNASNLLQSVEEAFKVVETVTVQGLAETGGDNSDPILQLVEDWQSKLTVQRSAEVQRAPRDELGLRRIERHNPPSLVHILR